MNEFSINYSPKRKIDFYYLAFTIYGIIIGLITCIKEVLIKNYSIIFYCSSVFIVLGIILLLYMLKSKPKPVVIINNESLNFNFSTDKPYFYLWKDIKKVGIGVSSFSIETYNSGTSSIDVSKLIYSDLKNTKGKIIEVCENKNIPFSNV